jgi:hypothetical protein
LDGVRKWLSEALAAKRGAFPQLLQSLLFSGSEDTHFLEVLQFAEVFGSEDGSGRSLCGESGEAWSLFSVDDALGFDSLTVENVAFGYFRDVFFGDSAVGVSVLFVSV